MKFDKMCVGKKKKKNKKDLFACVKSKSRRKIASQLTSNERTKRHKRIRIPACRLNKVCYYKMGYAAQESREFNEPSCEHRPQSYQATGSSEIIIAVT